MLDELLGRAALRERIAELEAENERLEERLDAESERRSDAVSARQEAERRVNRLEDRVAELEDRVERAGEGESAVEFRGTESLRGERVDAVLDRIGSFEAGPEGVLTAMVTDGRDLPEAVRAAVGERAALVRRAAPCLLVRDDAGVLSAALRPPVAPDPFVEWGPTARLERAWFRPTGSHHVALVRSDLFALGAYEGAERVGFHGFESDVQGAHTKGGFSQRRFERRRDEQVEDHLERCQAAIEAADADPDALYVVGESSVLPAFADRAAVTAPADASGDPEDALAAAVRDFWTVPLYCL